MLLIVVLSMLMLFLLLGMTYIVLASRTRTTSRAYLRLADEQSRTTLALRPLLREAAMQVIRGSQKNGSALKYHDLLGDRFGSAAERIAVTNRQLLSPDNDNGQLLRLTLAASAAAGRVLTFLDGPAGVAGTSTRIVDASGNNVTLVRPRGLSSSSQLPQIRTVAINRPDFVGQGFGSAADFPNWSLVFGSPLQTAGGSQSEDWDAADENNVAIASTAALLATSSAAVSFHRPAIFQKHLDSYRDHYSLESDQAAISEIVQALISGATKDEYQAEILKTLRRASIRPFALDHYQDPPQKTVDFTGKSITAANLWTTLTNPLDVDNDCDGQLDSVWVDVGEQAFSMPDGTLVKPLAAIKCIDLGGRLNVNAHGTLAHLAGAPNPIADPRLAKSGAAAPSVTMGLGFGPADVRLDSVLSSGSATNAVLLGANLDFGTGRIRRRIGNTVGRYGDGITILGTPAMPSGARSASRPASSLFLGSPSDYWGKLSIGLDHRGHPIFCDALPALSDTTYSPYELDVVAAKDANSYVQGNANPPTAPWVDQPFTPAEFEAVLRMNDPDNAAALPPRLLSILLSDLGRRDLITTESWDTPAFIGSVPINSTYNAELQRGLRMDLNRPFGDGADSDGDGVIDEPDETGLGPDNQNNPPSEPAANSNDPFGDVGKAGARSWTECGLTRGLNLNLIINQGIGLQPGPPLAGLRARQIMAENLYRILTYLAPSYGSRSLAQWSVNVVDFLDADSIMTPFRYKSGTSSSSVVWGCERPDLIITETLAFHDRAIADTEEDGGSGKKIDTNDVDADTNFDQVRVPQGSLFIELYAVRDPNSANLPRELYTPQGLLDLGRTPQNRTARGTAPIWRLAISKLRSASDSASDPFLLMRNNPSGEWLSPRGAPSADFIGTDGQYTPQGGLVSAEGGGSIPLERYVWFNEVQSSAAANASDPSPNEYNTFRLAGGTNQLKPGKYLVVGPRPETYFGSRVNTNRGERSPQRIVLGGAQSSAAVVYRFNPSDPSNAEGQINPTWASQDPAFGALPPVDGRPETQACWVQAKSPNWSDVNHSIGLNISEKRGDNYYDEPPKKAGNKTFASPPYGPLADVAEKYPDAPQDNGWPLSNAGLLAQGTHINVATVFLERLADPTRPHDPVAEINEIPGNSSSPLMTNPNWNPYIVVDLMPVDLTVFNGESRTRDPSVPQNKEFYFHTRQRGFDAWYADNGAFDLQQTLESDRPKTAANPWRPLMPYEKNKTDTTPAKPQPDTTTSSTANEAVAYFAHELGIVTQGAGQKSTIPYHTLGWVNLSYGRRLTPAEVAADYAGAPSTPFPWIVWHDRPFANEYEVVYVPRTPASRLLTDYRDVDSQPVANPPDSGPFGAAQPGWHLLPLTSITDAPSASNAQALGRLFAFVRVQSPFKGTTTSIDPDHDTTPVAFRAPFHRIPTFREPGHININTIPLGTNGSDIWKGICGIAGANSPTPDWVAMADGFAGPYRSVWQAPPGQTVAARMAELSPPSAGGHVAFSPSKSSWFRFQNVVRAASNTTTRSEVYAIWVTVGLFEVESMGGWQELRNTAYAGAPASAFDPLPVRRYPDWARLVREYGVTTGDVKRYRAFYLVDRSLPVCYEPGADNNVSDAVLIERFIE